jgi:hypothetical protein
MPNRGPIQDRDTEEVGYLNDELLVPSSDGAVGTMARGMGKGSLIAAVVASGRAGSAISTIQARLKRSPCNRA